MFPTDTIKLLISRDPSVPPEVPVRLQILVDGGEADQITIGSGTEEFQYAWAYRTAYVELRARVADTKRPVPLLIEDRSRH